MDLTSDEPMWSHLVRRSASSRSSIQDSGKTDNWMNRAICSSTDPEIFFSDNPHLKSVAKKICSECYVQKECLEYALNEEMYGIWGGTDERERFQLNGRSGKFNKTNYLLRKDYPKWESDYQLKSVFRVLETNETI